jgi:thiol-disulfide isomerase/thioredoxin
MSNPNLLYLNSNDFYITEGSKGKVLCNYLKDLTFVLFHADADKCPHCEELIPEFKKLPHFIQSCKFALVNLNKNQDIIAKSNQTIAPVTYVPYMILYVNGRPFLRYEGNRTLKDLVEFINEVIQRIKSKSNFVESKNSAKLEDAPSQYTYGIPYDIVCDEDKGICYVKYGDAYKK